MVARLSGRWRIPRLALMVRARLQNGSFTSSRKFLFGEPVFVTLRTKKKQITPRKVHKRTLWTRPFCPTFVHPCSFGSAVHAITYRPANKNDLVNICKFVDFWLSGGAKRLGISSAGSDYFVPYHQQEGYITRKITYIAIHKTKIIGWAVKTQHNSLIHLLVHPDYRGKGIGSRLLQILDPSFVRSKSDQSTGNPINFYKKHGYEIIEVSQGKKHNIDLLKKI